MADAARRPGLERGRCPDLGVLVGAVARRQTSAGLPRRQGSGGSRVPEAELGRVRHVHTLIQGVILGVLTSGVFALMASGQTLIFGIMKVVNLAQGAMVILGAYLSYQLFTS